MTTPAKSRTSRSRGLGSSSVSSMSEDESTALMDNEGSAGIGSPPTSRASWEEGPKTPPKSRRLFGEEEDESLSDLLQQFSPPAYPTSRYTLKPLDLNNGRRKSPRTPDTDMSTTTASPMRSPNSFRTIDGRFVQSKNPFSSPMVTEDDQKLDDDGHAGGPVPSFPVSFADSTSTGPARLPPRARFGFPDPRFGFTGSPIKEEEEPSKLRRLHLNDDVGRRRPSHVDTSAANKTSNDGNDDQISPTDAASFPYRTIRVAGPATPARPTRELPLGLVLPGPDKKATSRFHNDFDLIKELGQGSFGRVYQVLSRLDGCMYAIKTGHRPAKGALDRDRMLKEVYALAALSDQSDSANFHIVRYHQAWMENDRLYIQTELCAGTVSDEIQQTGRLDEARRFKLLREMLLALDFIHRNNMVHLDIKPENIFLKSSQFKLGDFGLVTQSSDSHDVEEGDSRYMSMELLNGDRADLTKSDIFSLGITLYEICRGSDPLPMNGPLWQDLRADRLHLPLVDTGVELTGLITQMMKSTPGERPTAVVLLEHPQLLSDDQKALNRERHKVAEANLQLAQIPKPRKRLVRANTWNGNLSVLL